MRYCWAILILMPATTATAEVDFRTEVIPVLAQAGCSSGACHGTPTGKGGFRLSLRGYLPELDHASITREMSGRRIDPLDPDSSLILRKASGRAAHEGGVRFSRDSQQYRILREWIAAGAPLAPAPALLRLEISPTAQILPPETSSVSLRVTAIFANGTKRDVTHLSRFSLSDPTRGEVENGGRVKVTQRGEVTVLAQFLHQIAASRLTFTQNRPGFAWSAPAPQNLVDHHTFAKLRLLQISPSGLCRDDEFVRRVTLDVCGILPSPEETRRFLADSRPDKRARYIDTLLQRDEYADHWSLKWVDRLGDNNRFVGKRGAYAYHQWIRDQVRANIPFDQFAFQILTATGPNYSRPAASFYRRIRDAESRAEAVSQLFLGVRIGCAKCHNHPFERWTQDDYYGLAAYFPRVRYKDGPFFQGIYNKEETIWLDRVGEVTHPRTGRTVVPKPLGGESPSLNSSIDRREALAHWITSVENPYFARVAVNRIWYHLFGRGLVEPVDDFRDSNPPAHPELLDALAAEFVKNRFDTKHVLRLILNSATYQLSASTNRWNEADEVYFSHARMRLLSAEQLLDAVSSVTGVPERFAGVPPATRAAQLPDGELAHPFLKAFGRPARAIECECERESDTTLEQALLLKASRVIHDKIRAEDGLPARLAASSEPPTCIAETLFLTALCRFPTTDEREFVVRAIASASDRRKAMEDLVWLLLNHREFLFQH